MKYIIGAGVLILIGFLVALQFIPIGIEPLTEVYFENHTKLPANVFLNRSYNYTFTVHNLEYRTMNYQYNITEVFGGQIIEELTTDLENITSNVTGITVSDLRNITRPVFRTPVIAIKSGNFTLDNNQSISLFENFSFSRRFDRAQIVINITKDNNESIDIAFWVDEIVPVKITIEKDNQTSKNLTKVNLSSINPPKNTT